MNYLELQRHVAQKVKAAKLARELAPSRKERAINKNAKAAQAVYKDIVRGSSVEIEAEVQPFEGETLEDQVLAIPAIRDWNVFGGYDIIEDESGNARTTTIQAVVREDKIHILELGQGEHILVWAEDGQWYLEGNHNTPQGFWDYSRRGEGAEELKEALKIAQKEHLYFQEYGAILNRRYIHACSDERELVEEILDWIHVRFGRDQAEWPSGLLHCLELNHGEEFGVDTLERAMTVMEQHGEDVCWYSWRQAGCPTGPQASLAIQPEGWLDQAQKDWQQTWGHRELHPRCVIHYTEECVYALHAETHSWSLKQLLAEGKERLAKMHPETAYIRPYMAAKAFGLDKHLREGASWNCKDLGLSRVLEKMQRGYKVPKGLDTSAYIGRPDEADCCMAAVSLAAFLGVAAGSVNPRDVVYMADHCARHIGEIPIKFQKGVAISRSLLEWVVEKGFAVDWTLGNSAKVCVIRTLMATYGLTETGAEELLLHPAAEEALAFASRVSNAGVTDTLPAFDAEVNGVRMTKMPKQDLRNLYIGELSSCCQKLGGAGEAVCTEGWVDPHSVNYVFSKGSTILAHVWVWEAECGTLVLDSIEARTLTAGEIAPLIQLFVDSVGSRVAIAKCGYGVTLQVLAALSGKPAGRLVGKLDYSYTDYKSAGSAATILSKSV